MSIIELKKLVTNTLPKWRVTIDEAQMLNLTADDLNRCDGVAYIEEFNTSVLGNTRFGVKLETKHEITFCVFAELEQSAEEREVMRNKRVMPAVKAVQKALMQVYDGLVFTMDKYPRGFDANEVLVHITFTTTDNVCLD